MTVAVTCLLLGWLLLHLWELWNVLREDQMIRDLQDFRRRFPDRCAICSFHRFSVEYGFERRGSKPGKHYCTEVA